MHSEESRLEDELREALGRVEAPTGFADSVLQRAAAESKLRGRYEPARPGHVGGNLAGRLPAMFPSLRRLAGWTSGRGALAAALLLALLLPAGGYLRQRYREARAVAAAQQFTLAMRLTRAALIDAEEHAALHGRDRRPTP